MVFKITLNFFHVFKRKQNKIETFDDVNNTEITFKNFVIDFNHGLDFNNQGSVSQTFKVLEHFRKINKFLNFEKLFSVFLECSQLLFVLYAAHLHWVFQSHNDPCW